MASINQNTPAPVLPDFRNLGVILRILLAVNGAAGLVAVAQANRIGDISEHLGPLIALTQPPLLASLVLLGVLGPRLLRWPYRTGVAVVGLVVIGVVSLAFWGYQRISLFADSLHWWKFFLFAALGTAVLLLYLHLRGRALSPALAEARLQALQARIRPHFLFNSITAVLSLIREDPKRAERALEDLAELFRVLMADNRQLTSLEDEVTLTRQYLELEQLRLGERLKVAWHTDKMPPDALIPPLILQPLVENAVYHGIEPSAQPGEITINIYEHRKQVYMVLRNPYLGEGSHHVGNKMAMNNIRERLALHFDVEASLKQQVIGTNFQVTIAIPYRMQRA